MKPQEMPAKANDLNDYASIAFDEQALVRKYALCAAMQESMENLALDEQYVMGLLFSELRERHDSLAHNPNHGMDVHLTMMPFMRRCLVDYAEATTRLSTAAHALTARTIKARYPAEHGACRMMNHHICWFESLAIRADEITLHLNGEILKFLLAATPVDLVEESASMVSDFLANV